MGLIRSDLATLGYVNVLRENIGLCYKIIKVIINLIMDIVLISLKKKRLIFLLFFSFVCNFFSLLHASQTTAQSEQQFSRRLHFTHLAGVKVWTRSDALISDLGSISPILWQRKNALSHSICLKKMTFSFSNRISPNSNSAQSHKLWPNFIPFALCCMLKTSVQTYWCNSCS